MIFIFDKKVSRNGQKLADRNSTIKYTLYKKPEIFDYVS